MTQPHLIPRKLKSLITKGFGAPQILRDPDTNQVSPSILRTGGAVNNPVLSHGYHMLFRCPSLPPPLVQVRPPLPPYFGGYSPMWRMPRPMTATLPSGESQLFSDSSSDSSAEDSQDPDLDSHPCSVSYSSHWGFGPQAHRFPHYLAYYGGSLLDTWSFNGHAHFVSMPYGSSRGFSLLFALGGRYGK